MAREGIMECQPFTKKRFDKWMAEDGYCFGQPKLNGTRCRWDGEHQYSSGAAVVNCLPHLDEQLAFFRYRNPAFKRESTGLDGEHYVHGLPLQDIRRLTGRTKTIHPDHAQVEYWIFDVTVTGMRQEPRLNFLEQLADTEQDFSYPNLRLVRSSPIPSYKLARDYVVAQVDMGFEGAVFRRKGLLWEPKRSTGIMKWKPKGEDKYKIVAVFRGEGKFARTLGALEVEDNLGQQFHVGSFKITDAKRDEYWHRHLAGDLIGQMAIIEYCEVTKSDLLPSSVFKMTLDEAGPGWKPKKARVAA